jgi:hypothetical protein
VYYISYWKAQWFKSRLLRLENFHSFACQNHRIIFYLPWYAPCYGCKLMGTNYTILPVSRSRCSGTVQVKYLVFLATLCYIALVVQRLVFRHCRPQATGDCANCTDCTDCADCTDCTERIDRTTVNGIRKNKYRGPLKYDTSNLAWIIWVKFGIDNLGKFWHG